MSKSQIFKYYLTQRPPSIGTHPTNDLLSGDIEEVQIESKGNRWCYVLNYKRKLSDDEVRRFELTPKINKEIIGNSYDIVFNGKVEIVNVSECGTIISVKETYPGSEIIEEQYTPQGFLKEYNINLNSCQQKN